MPLFVWTPELSVGVTEMDNQHKKLIDIINRLHDAMKVGKGKDVLSGLLKEMEAYTQFHFTAEEKYMQQFSYSGLVSQKKEHQAFIDKVKVFITDFNNGKMIGIDTMDFLKNWLSKHIQGIDKQYSKVFNEHGLK